MIYTEATLSDFREAFRQCNHSDNFTHEGLQVLFDYLEDYSKDTGENIELDVILLCCDYREGNASDVIQDYNLDYTEEMSEEELSDVARDYLQENTVLLGETLTGFVYLNF